MAASPREMGSALARKGPLGPLPEDGPATPAPDLEGRWRVERVVVHGKAVPLPKGQSMGLDFQKDGTLLVQGIHGLKPTREQGVWRLREGKLHTRVGQLREVSAVQRSGDELTLTRMGPLAVVWELRRAAPSSADASQKPEAGEGAATRPSPASR